MMLWRCQYTPLWIIRRSDFQESSSMTENITSSPYRESLLSARKLRELIREARGGFAPDHVGRALRHREPAVLPEDQEELCELLRKLAESARERLHDVGLEPEYAENDEAQKLP